MYIYIIYNIYTQLIYCNDHAKRYKKHTARKKKHEFATIYYPPLENDIDLEQQMLADLKIAQELEESEREAERQRCAAQSAMIAEQNRAYEESVKVDLQNSQKSRKDKEASKNPSLPELQFEEVSLEEMRRVRLLRFQR